MVVRTRFAPSPTGFLHVGGVRTALFSWLYAKHHQGQFILRIEDTDQERSTKESVQAILEGMDWLGLTADEGPFYQTERYGRYHEVLQQLLDQGQAYHCNCSKERLEQLRATQLAQKLKPRYDGHCREKHMSHTHEPCVIRFKTPSTGHVAFHDQVYGEIHVENQELDDLVLLRSDGHPTYNFAVVVDDWDMKITHVIRGDDHINNTPRQINLFRALNAEIPVYAHLPMILGEDGKRLSKRHGAVSVMQFKEEGYLPHALLNYLVRLGWSAQDQEIFSLDEMIEKFDLKQVSRAAASFNYAKLTWLNQHYLKSDPPSIIVPALAAQFAQHKIDYSLGPNLHDLLEVQKDRCKTLEEMCEKSRFFYEEFEHFDPEAVQKCFKTEIFSPLQKLLESFKKLSDWNRDTLQTCINDITAEFNISMGKIAQPLRIAVTGSTISPSIDVTLQLLGREKVINRMEKALNFISNLPKTL